METLHVEGLKRNRRLARVMADAALGNLRRQLRYKCPWSGSRLVEATPFDPSRKRGPRWGAVKDILPLGARPFGCEVCGLILDRDENAACNLAALAATVAGSGPETSNARGGNVSPVARPADPEETGSRRETAP